MGEEPLQDGKGAMLQVLAHFMSTTAVERVRFVVEITATTLAFALVIAIIFIA